VSAIFKGIARELAIESGIEVCRGYMIERMRPITTTDLYKAIKDGTHTMGVAEGKDRNFGKKWARVIEKLSYKGQRIKREYLTAENVLEWLRMDRPELASLIINMNPKGMEWLREDVKEVYNFLFPETKPQPQPKPLTLVKKQPEPVAPPIEKTAETPKETQIEEQIQEQKSEDDNKT